MLKLTEEQLDWLTEQIPHHTPSPKGGRPPMDKRKAIQGVFWILDNGAKWKDLQSGSAPRALFIDGSSSGLKTAYSRTLCVMLVN